MTYYRRVSDYMSFTRSALQDMVEPYRYADTDVVNALNMILGEIARVRPDIFLDGKYQRRLGKGDINDYAPGPYDPVKNINTVVPIPNQYINPIIWGTTGWLQLYDVADTQDQRAAAFLQRFNTHFMTLTAA